MLHLGRTNPLIRSTAARKPEQLNQLSASLTHIAYLLVRVSSYLSVRLPCEITLPHKNYPLPTIFNLPSSHLGCDVQFPGHTPYHSSSTSPEASRVDLRGGQQQYHGPPPRPRLLAIDQSLPELAKDDPPKYRFFIEAVTLLAWDVAWLCQSQGAGPFKQWEDICPMGRNLYQLLISRSGSSTTANATTSHNGHSNGSARENQLGRFSHGNANGFLGAASSSNGGQDPFKGWRLTTPTRAIDKLKSHLLLEMQGAEWEVLDEGDYAGATAEMQEEGILVGGARTGGPRTPPTKGKEGTIPTPAQAVQPSGSSASFNAPRVNSAAVGGDAKEAREGRGDDAETPKTHRPGGTNGWMKVRDRSEGKNGSTPPVSRRT
jgi:hypothetical protein